MPFKCSECGQESKFASLSVCHQNKKQSFQKLKELLVCKSCEKKAQHKICIQHHEAAKTMGDAFDRKVEQITCDELPEIREELYEFGKKLNDKVNLIRARNKEMWDEIYGKTGNIEYAMNLLERTLDVDEEVQQVKELLKKIEKKLKQEITSNQNVNRTMSSASFEEMNGSSVELIPDDYIPPPPYEEADCDLVNRSSPESANPLRPILKRDGYSVPVEENIDRRSRPVTRNRSRSRRRPSVQFRDLSLTSHRSGITVDDEVAEKRIQGIYTGPQFVFENRNRSLRHIQVEFSYEAKRHGIRDDGRVSCTLTNHSLGTMCIFILYYSPFGIRFYAPTMEIKEDRKPYRQAFEISSKTSATVDLDFSKALGILDAWTCKKEAGYYPFIRMKALGQMKDDGQHDWQEWTIRFDRRENKWFPRFDRDPPRDNVDYRK